MRPVRSATTGGPVPWFASTLPSVFQPWVESGAILVQRHGARFARFMVVGLSGVFVNMGLLWFLTDVVGIYYLVSSLVAVEVSIITNYLVNNVWTFRDRSQGVFRYTALGKYNLVCAGGMVTSTAILFVLSSVFGVYYLAANMVAIGTTALWNFGANSRWTWKNTGQKGPTH